MRDSYFKDEWYDYEKKPAPGDTIQTCSFEPALVIATDPEWLSEDACDRGEEPYDVEVHYLGLYSNQVGSCSGRHCNPVVIRPEYVPEYLATAPYHRWIMERFSSYYSKDPDWMGWFGDRISEWARWVLKADEILDAQGWEWVPEPVTKEWEAAFFADVKRRRQGTPEELSGTRGE